MNHRLQSDLEAWVCIAPGLPHIRLPRLSKFLTPYIGPGTGRNSLVQLAVMSLFAELEFLSKLDLTEKDSRA